MDRFAAPIFAVATPLPADQKVHSRSAALPAPKTFVRRSDGASLTASFEWELCVPPTNPDEPNCSADYWCAIGTNEGASTTRNWALSNLLGNMISEPFFDSLRTKQQLGYIVNGSCRDQFDVVYLRFVVQSTKVDHPRNLKSRIDDFLVDFGRSLREMPSDKFESFRESLIAKNKEEAQSIAGQGGALWNTIVGNVEFKQHALSLKVIPSLTQKEVVEFFESKVKPGGKDRRVFITCVEKNPEAKMPEDPASAAAAAADAAKAEEEKAASPAEAPVPVVEVPLELSSLLLAAQAGAEFEGILEAAGVPVPAGVAGTDSCRVVFTFSNPYKFKSVVPMHTSYNAARMLAYKKLLASK